MKILLTLLALSLLSVVALAEDDLSNIQTVDLVVLNTGSQQGIEGKIVKLTFGWKEGDFLAASNGPRKKGVGRIGSRAKVSVPDAGKAWFAALPTKADSPSTQSVYLRLHSNAPAEVLGRELRDGKFSF